MPLTPPEIIEQHVKDAMEEPTEQRRAARINLLEGNARAIADVVQRLASMRWLPGGFDFDEWSREAETTWSALTHAEQDALLEALLPAISREVGMVLRASSGDVRRPIYRSNRPDSTVSVLVGLTHSFGRFDRDSVWIAEHAIYFAYQAVSVLVAALERDDDVASGVLEVLLDTCRGTHPFASVSHDALEALARASIPEGWEMLRSLLLAAKRQEGLRAQILQAAIDGHSGCLARIMRTVADDNLTRFSAVTAVVDQLLGLQWVTYDGKQQAELVRTVGLFADLLVDRPRAEALASSGLDGVARPHDLHVALVALGRLDSVAAMASAQALLAASDAEVRFVAVQYLQVCVQAHRSVLLPALADEDLRVVARALPSFRWVPEEERGEGQAEYEVLRSLLDRLPSARALPPAVWEWTATALDPSTVADALVVWHRGGSAVELLPYEKRMSAYGRSLLMGALAAEDEASPDARGALLAHLNDPSGSVRDVVLARLTQTGVSADEAVRLETALTTKRSDVRRRIITVLRAQSPDALAISVERLRAAKHDNQRRAAEELLPAEPVEGDGPPSPVRGLGLIDDALRSPRGKPACHEGELIHPDGYRVLEALATATDDTGENLLERLSAAAYGHRAGDEEAKQAHELAIAAILAWWEASGTALFGPGDLTPGAALCHAALAAAFLDAVPGVESDAPNLFRGLGSIDVYNFSAVDHADAEHDDGASSTEPPRRVSRAVETSRWLLTQVVDLLLHRVSFADGIDSMLDVVEHCCARLAERGVVVERERGWIDDRRGYGHTSDALRLSRRLAVAQPALWTTEQWRRLWALERWLDEPDVESAIAVPRMRVGLDDLLAYMALDIANEHDLFDHLVGDCTTAQQSPTHHHYYWQQFGSLAELTRRRSELRDKYPFVMPHVERAVGRVLDVELSRGDLSTAATGAARHLSYLTGMEIVVRSLRSLGDEGIKRGLSWRNDGDKASSLSRVLRATFPSDADTSGEFAQLAQDAGIRPATLLALAVFAPQWAEFVEAALGWEGLADAAWWVCAHTKDPRWSVESDVREQWAGQISERTPLTGGELVEGAVDIGWFTRGFRALGAERWGKVYDAAKYASSGIGHARAKLFADAILGRVTLDELRARVDATRHQDAIRAVGLVPFDGARDARTRYEFIHRYAAGSKKFGSQRRDSEATAVRIALANLARTAGYRDTLRLSWSMEAELVADLAAGPVTVSVGVTTIALTIDAEGVPALDLSKNGKPLAAVPAAAKKDPQTAELLARHKSLNGQVRRVRASLESMMVRGDIFNRDELADMLRHPMVAAMLRRLLVVDDRTGSVGRCAAGKNAPSLVDPEGTPLKVAKGARLRIAHGSDLVRDPRAWVDWQTWIVENQERQPFKQVFRELYVPTSEERGRTSCERYRGHQVNPSQATALLTGRGWVSRPYEGASVTFHEAGVTAWIDTEIVGHYSQAVEAPALSGVSFVSAAKVLPLGDVPPRVFSEVLRDLDLVVSVAHVGGVDPEASQSTVEMRAALVETTCRLLRLDNVRLDGHHVRIEGLRGRYDVHLGSGTVLLLPARSVCIVAVSAQHRGRIFLPFADDDPRTAEVMSKVVLLARDHEIKDPTILSQLR